MSSTRDDGPQGKVAVISGVANGIGQAVAAVYARAGVKTVADYLPGDPHDLAEKVAPVMNAGEPCLPIAVDVRSAEQCDAFAQRSVSAAATRGILRLCRSLATELAPLEAGELGDPQTDRSPQPLDRESFPGQEGLAAAATLIRLARVGTAEEFARTVRFLTSADAAYITEQPLIVEGGLTVRRPN